MTFIEKAKVFLRHPIKVIKLWCNGMVLVKASEIEKGFFYYTVHGIFTTDSNGK